MMSNIFPVVGGKACASLMHLPSSSDFQNLNTGVVSLMIFAAAPARPMRFSNCSFAPRVII
jgi:hypothetical protein